MHGERSPSRAPNGALSKLTTLLLMIPGEPGGTAQNHALRKYVAEQPATMAESVLRGEDYGLKAEGATDEDIIYLARTGAKAQGGGECGKDDAHRTDIFETNKCTPTTFTEGGKQKPAQCIRMGPHNKFHWAILFSNADCKGHQEVITEMPLQKKRCKAVVASTVIVCLKGDEGPHVHPECRLGPEAYPECLRG